MLKNQEVCVVAGMMAAGSDCVNTLGGFNKAISLEETIKLLEGDPHSGTPAAFIISAEDFTEMKNDLDVLCKLLGDRCSMDRYGNGVAGK